MKPDGGPAFPVPRFVADNVLGLDSSGRVLDPGMSLRDYFAAASLIGLRMAFSMNTSEMISQKAMEDADAMLAERKKK